MPVSARVRDGDNAEDHVNGHLICKVGRKFGIYGDASYYSQTSGGVQKRGTLVRRWDPDAGDLEGKPAKFATLAEAVAYAERWLGINNGRKGVKP